MQAAAGSPVLGVGNTCPLLAALLSRAGRGSKSSPNRSLALLTSPAGRDARAALLSHQELRQTAPVSTWALGHCRGSAGSAASHLQSFVSDWECYSGNAVIPAALVWAKQPEVAAPRWG